MARLFVRAEERRRMEEEDDADDAELERRLAEEGYDEETHQDVQQIELSSGSEVPLASGSSQTGVSQSERKRSGDGNGRVPDSEVWKHFTTTANKMRKCKHCSKTYSSSTATGNMRYHLKQQHLSLLKTAIKSATTGSSSFFNLAKDSKKKEIVKLTRLQSKPIDKELFRLFYSASLSHKTVDSPAFKTFCSKLNPAYCPPSANTVKKGILDEYADYRQQMIAFFKTCQGRFSITSDFWTSCVGEGFLAVTCHWMSPEWKTQKALLDFLYVHESHTAKVISDRLFRILKEFKLHDRVLAVITDEGSNFKAAMEANGKLLEKLTSARTESGKGSQCKHLRNQKANFFVIYAVFQIRSFVCVVSLMLCITFAKKDCEKSQKQCRKSGSS
jgi:BED zinc finger